MKYFLIYRNGMLVGGTTNEKIVPGIREGGATVVEVTKQEYIDTLRSIGKS
jgi:hypothetical protein